MDIDTEVLEVTLDIKKILAMFEAKYKGYPEETEMICSMIAEEHGYDKEQVMDIVYINRYNEDESLESQEIDPLTDEEE